jgi:MFS transporter, ACS family, tartrate transporter
MSSLNPAEDLVVRKVIRRIIPFLMLCFLMNFLDRNNVAVAELSLSENPTLGFTTAVFSWGLAIFYIPYCLFEIPSNLIQMRVGARWWIARIMVSWGITSACFVFIAGPQSFYWLRGILGLFEAGFFPGVMLFLSLWIPHAHRARAKALFFLSSAFAGIISNILGALILYYAGKYNMWLAPWQWLFLLEGIPSVILGIVVLFYLTDKPEDAHWLAADERERLVGIMAREAKANPGHSASEFMDALRSGHTWILAIVYSAMNWAFNPVQFYTQSTLKEGLKSAGTVSATTPGYLTNLYVGLLSAIPFGVAAVAMLLIARQSDKNQSRKPYIMGCCGLMAFGLALGGASQWFPGWWKTVAVLAGLSLAAIGWFGSFATFWAIPATIMTGAAVAAAMAIINAIGNLMGNYVANTVRPKLQFNGIDYALFVAAGVAVLGVIATAMLRMPKSKAAVASPEEPAPAH